MKRRLWLFVCVLVIFMLGASSCTGTDADTIDTNDTTTEQGATDGSQDADSEKGEDDSQDSEKDDSKDTEKGNDESKDESKEDSKEDSKDDENSSGNDNSQNSQNGQCSVSGEHSYVEVSRTDALALKDGEIKYVCSSCNGEHQETIPATKSLKILALGNSFTDDSTWHLWNICNDAGVKDLVVANLYVGNCTLDQHWKHISTSANPYIYRKTTNGTRVDNNNYRILDALKDEEWDYIVLHQTSGSAGQEETYSKLDFIIRFINMHKTNPDAKILWHMPWAYPSYSTHSEFPKYDKDQMKMYETLVARVNEIILPKKTISGVIPSGTAIQNLRTSYVGDTVTRDEFHLNYGFGRYTAGLTWYAILTGGDVDAPDWVPEAYPEVEMYLPAIREAVKGAVTNKFEVTESKIKTVEEGLELGGYDLSKYDLLEWDYETNAWWNCEGSTTITHPSEKDGTYNQNICVDRKYSIEELPVGTIFVCDNGWRFRLEQYPTENEKYTGSRHGGQIAPLFVLNETFLNGCTYVAWSVSTYPKTDISQDFDEAYTHVKIYVPKG